MNEQEELDDFLNYKEGDIYEISLWSFCWLFSYVGGLLFL